MCKRRSSALSFSDDCINNTHTHNSLPGILHLPRYSITILSHTLPSGRCISLFALLPRLLFSVTLRNLPCHPQTASEAEIQSNSPKITELTRYTDPSRHLCFSSIQAILSCRTSRRPQHLLVALQEASCYFFQRTEVAHHRSVPREL